MTSPHRRPVLVVALTLLSAGAAGAICAAGAWAATIAADNACYVNSAIRASVLISGHGFVPGHQVQVSGLKFVATAAVAADGTFGATAPAPSVGSGPVSRALRLTATDVTGTGDTAQTTIHVTNLAVAVSKTVVKNVRKDKVTFTFSGFTAGRHIYGYYLRRKVVARAEFARAEGACGTLRERALLFPGGRPRSSAYTVVFEDTARYSATAFPRVTGNFKLIHL